MVTVAESFVRRTKRNNQHQEWEAALKEKRPTLVKTDDVVFHYDNVRPHIVELIRKKCAIKRAAVGLISVLP